MPKKLATALLLICSWTCFASNERSPPKVHDWLVGIWEATYDEDHTPLDSEEFRADGTWIAYGEGCASGEGRYHVFGGNVFIVFEVPGKGPVALVYHPNPERTMLTYTSPRTHNNATYERAKTQKRPCQAPN